MHRRASGESDSCVDRRGEGALGEGVGGEERHEAQIGGLFFSHYLANRTYSQAPQMIMGRQKLKKSFRYEVKWRGLDHKFNTWVPREDLLAKGFTKLVQQFDDLESSREGAGSRDTSAHLVRKHLEDIGLDGDIAQYNEISGLSGGKHVPYLHSVNSSNLWIDRSKNKTCPRRLSLEQPTGTLPHASSFINL